MASERAPSGEDTVLDTRGARCPIPVLKARKRLRALPCGAVLTLLCDDPLAAVDVPNFCREDGHTLLASNAREDGLTFRIAKG